MEVLKAAAESRSGTALVTVIDANGSVPRHPGSKMLVREEGGIVGTVGGGRGEAKAIDVGHRCIAEKCSRLIMVEMAGEAAEGPDMICGGTATLLVEYVADTELYRGAYAALQAGRRVVLLKRLAVSSWGAGGTVATVVWEEGTPQPVGIGTDAETLSLCMSTGKTRLSDDQKQFVDPLLPLEKLLILGGGHIGQILAMMAVKLDFEVTVVDDRADFSVAGRFPAEVKSVRAPFADAVASFHFDSATYVVIVTRGHLFDLECLRAVLRRTYRYAGFVGSVRKATMLKEQAVSDGFDAQKVAAVRAPVGVDIDAETPAEIAISILAEIVAVRRNPGAASAPSP